MARRNDDRRAGRSAAGRSTPDLAALGNQRVTLRFSRPRSGGGRVGREPRKLSGQPANKNELTRAGMLLPRLWSRWEQISGERAALVPGEPLKQPVPVGTGRCEPVVELVGYRGSFRAVKPEPPAIVSRSVQIAFGAARAANGQAVLPEPDPGEPVLVRNFPFAHQAVQRHAVCATGFEVFHRTSVTAWIRQTGLTFLTSSAKSSPFLGPLSGPLGISWHCRPFHGVSRPGEARRLHRFTHQNGRTTKLVFVILKAISGGAHGRFSFCISRGFVR